MATAFVAGATGYTGQEVVAELRRRGTQTWAHVRPDSSRRAEFTSRFEGLGAQVDATAWDEAALTARFVELRPDLLFALLGTTRSRAKEEGAGAAEEGPVFFFEAKTVSGTAGTSSSTTSIFFYFDLFEFEARETERFRGFRNEREHLEERERESGE